MLAQLHLQSLIGNKSPKALKLALQKLPSGSDVYSQVYDEVMARIESQDIDSRELAKQVLLWITCARRPLKAVELQTALAVGIGELALDKENLPEIETMVSVCAGLVIADQGTGIIHLVHYTAQEYFMQNWKIWFPDGATQITMACVTYLSFSAFNGGFCPTYEKFEERRRLHMFYDRAACNWRYHAHGASAVANPLIIRFLEDKNHIASCVQAILAPRYDHFHNYSQRVWRDISGLHLSVQFDLADMVSALVKKGHYPDQEDGTGRTPLSWAAEGQLDIVEFLIRQDRVDIGSKDDCYRFTPLWWAIKSHHLETAALLLRNGAQPTLRDKIGRTPLWWALETKDLAVLTLLVDKGLDPNFRDKDNGPTPLEWAISDGDETIAKLFLAKGARLTAKNESDGDLLKLAMSMSELKLATWLLEDGSGEALVYASMTQDMELAQLLLDQGIDANSP